jgi:hypothetical protein
MAFTTRLALGREALRARLGDCGAESAETSGEVSGLDLAEVLGIDRAEVLGIDRVEVFV